MKVIAAWLRRGMKSLFVLNLAALWLLLREGRKMAVAYMRQAYTLYLHRAFLPLRTTVPPLLPSAVPISTKRFGFK